MFQCPFSSVLYPDKIFSDHQKAGATRLQKLYICHWKGNRNTCKTTAKLFISGNLGIKPPGKNVSTSRFFPLYTRNKLFTVKRCLVLYTTLYLGRWADTCKPRWSLHAWSAIVYAINNPTWTRGNTCRMREKWVPGAKSKSLTVAGMFQMMPI